MNAQSAASPSATLLVCVTCKSDEGPLGAGLFAALADRLAGEVDIALRPIECLSVCKRPCTVALAAPGKWTYVVGDLTREAHIEDIVDRRAPLRRLARWNRSLARAAALLPQGRRVAHAAARAH